MVHPAPHRTALHCTFLTGLMSLPVLSVVRQCLELNECCLVLVLLLLHAYVQLGDNSNQDKAGFAPFGEIQTASGLAIARRIFNPTPNHTMGIDQGKYEAKGNAWIRDNYAGTNFILGAAVTSAA
jgi:hypothetical protein